MPHTYEVRIDRLGLWDCFFTVKLSSELSCRCSLVQCANYSYTNTVYCIVNFSDICHTLNVSTIIWVLCSLDLKVLASEYLKPFENQAPYFSWHSSAKTQCTNPDWKWTGLCYLLKNVLGAAWIFWTAGSGLLRSVALPGCWYIV